MSGLLSSLIKLTFSTSTLKSLGITIPNETSLNEWIVSSEGAVMWSHIEKQSRHGLIKEKSILLFWASLFHKNDLIKELVDEGIDVDTQVNILDSGLSALYIAAYLAHTETVALLLNLGASINQTVGKGKITPLYIASRNGHVDTVELLVTHGARVDQECENGATSLFIASYNGHYNTAKILIDNGASVNKANSVDEHTPLSIAALNGHEETVKLLLKNDASVKVIIRGWSLLFSILMKGHCTITKYLLEAGATVSNLPSGFTQLMKKTLIKAFETNTTFTKLPNETNYFNTVEREALNKIFIRNKKIIAHREQAFTLINSFYQELNTEQSNSKQKTEKDSLAQRIEKANEKIHALLKEIGTLVPDAIQIEQINTQWTLLLTNLYCSCGLPFEAMEYFDTLANPATAEAQECLIMLIQGYYGTYGTYSSEIKVLPGTIIDKLFAELLTYDEDLKKLLAHFFIHIFSTDSEASTQAQKFTNDVGVTLTSLWETTPQEKLQTLQLTPLRLILFIKLIFNSPVKQPSESCVKAINLLAGLETNDKINELHISCLIHYFGLTHNQELPKNFRGLYKALVEQKILKEPYQILSHEQAKNRVITYYNELENNSKPQEHHDLKSIINQKDRFFSSVQIQNIDYPNPPYNQIMVTSRLL